MRRRNGSRYASTPLQQGASKDGCLPLQEAERTLFFLSGLSRLAASWQMALVTAPALARQAATDWLSFAAAPSADCDFTVSCPPVTQADRVRRTHLTINSSTDMPDLLVRSGYTACSSAQTEAQQCTGWCLLIDILESCNRDCQRGTCLLLVWTIGALKATTVPMLTECASSVGRRHWASLQLEFAQHSDICCT